jgi:hypothetical protein
MCIRTGAKVLPKARRAAQDAAGRRPRKAEPEPVVRHKAGCHHGLLGLVPMLIREARFIPAGGEPD